MASYVQVTDFSDKDALTTGDPEKAISGADVDGEFAAIATAIDTKQDDLGTGTNGQMLTTDGVTLSWGGNTTGWTQIGATQTASASAYLEFTDLDTSYRLHQFVLHDIVPGTADDFLWMRIYRSGTIFTSANYQWHAHRSTQAATTYAGGASGGTEDTYWILSGGDAGAVAGDGWTGTVTVIDPASGRYNANWSGSYIDTVSAGQMVLSNGAGRTTSSGGSTQNGMRFSFSTGTIASGTIALYGIA